MTAENFCYWLQGFFEITGIDKVNRAQVEMIKKHLDLVFEKQTRVISANVPPPFTLQVTDATAPVIC